MSKAQKDIENEINNQLSKWGEQNHEDLYWLGIVGEEFGEVSKEIIENNPEKTREEIVQLAACCVSWIEAIDRRNP